MTLEQFENDDRFATIDSTDIGCHGGAGHRIKQVCKAAAWMLDPANSTAFIAVLDPEDMTVATLEDGCYVFWTPLDDFEV